MKKARKTSDQMRQETIDALNLFIAVKIVSSRFFN